MSESLPLPREIWERTPPEAQALILSLIEQVQILSRRLDELEATNRKLLERLGKNSRNSSKPPSSDRQRVKRAPPRQSSGKKRGGQPGHPRAVRPLVPSHKVRDTFVVKPAECRKCGHGLSGQDPQPLRHQVAEIPSWEPVVDEYQLHRLTCGHCETVTCGTLPEGVPRGHFGPRLQAMIALLSGVYRLGKRPIQLLVRDFAGLSISTGMICKLQRQMVAILARPVAQLQDHIRTQDANMDETSWQENRRRNWLWIVVTPWVTVYRIARTRGACVVRELLGKSVPYVVTCDRAKAYRHLKRVQWCWAHLQRDFQAMIDRGGAAREIGTALLGHSEVLFSWWYQVRDGTWSRTTFIQNMGNLRHAFHAELERGRLCSCEKTAATCGDLLSQEPWLWTFVRREGIEPTNNAAEQAARHAVLWRKCSGGTDSPRGSRFVESILSVVVTCRQQNRNVLQFVTKCTERYLENRRPPSLLPATKLRQTA